MRSGDGQRGESHVNEQADVAVAQVVNADALHSGPGTATLDLTGEPLL